jgi:hypothetical protein
MYYVQGQQLMHMTTTAGPKSYYTKLHCAFSVSVNVFTLQNCSPSSGLPGLYCTTSLSSQEYRKIPSATAQPAVRNEYGDIQPA